MSTPGETSKTWATRGLAATRSVVLAALLRAVSIVFVAFWVVVVFTLLPGCGGRTLKRIEPADALLPKELEEQFAVRNTDAKESPPAVELGKNGKPLKSKRKTKKEKAAERAAAKFKFPSRRPAVDPILRGEVLKMDVSYLGVTAAELTIQQLPFKFVNSRKVYHHLLKIESTSVFNMVHRINDSIESFWDYEGLFSHRYHMILDEKDQTRDALELNDSVRKQTFYWNRWNHVKKGYVETKEFKEMVPFSQDSISLIQYVRMIPLKVGDKIKVPAVTEGKNWVVEANVLRRENISTILGDRDCFVLKPEIYLNGELQKKGEIYLWVTDDDRRYPVKLEAKVKFGSVKLTLASLEPGVPEEQFTETPVPSPLPSSIPSQASGESSAPAQ